MRALLTRVPSGASAHVRWLRQHARRPRYWRGHDMTDIGGGTVPPAIGGPDESGHGRSRLIAGALLLLLLVGGAMVAALALADGGDDDDAIAAFPSPSAASIEMSAPLAPSATSAAG